MTHGLQAVAVCLISHYGAGEKRGGRTCIGLLVGVIINVVGYSIGRSFVYATPKAALLKLPFQIFQASFGAVVAGLLCFKAGIMKVFKKVAA